MSRKEIVFDSQALEQWATDGGYVPVDEATQEGRRHSLSELRRWLLPVVGNENDLALLAGIVEGRLTVAEFASDLGIHRANGKRRIESFIRRVRSTLESNPNLFESMPSPWREVFTQP